MNNFDKETVKVLRELADGIERGRVRFDSQEVTFGCSELLTVKTKFSNGYEFVFNIKPKSEFEKLKDRVAEIERKCGLL